MEPSITPLGSGNNQSMHNNLNSHHLNGSRGGQYHQDDAIVPASDDEHQDESTDEDEEEYNSYLHEQEQKQHIQDITHEDEYLHRQQQQHLHAYKSQAMNIQQLLRQDQLQQEHDENGDMDLDSEDEFGHHDNHDLDHNQYDHDHDHERQDTLLDDEDDDSFDDERGPEDALDDMMDEDEEEDDEGSETISLTEDDIDFNLVYAFHTFVATQEGQASVVRNDSLMLLEDTNVYWWLVRVLKTGVIGYIPAENIETPFERLARLNTYRNVSLSAPTAEWGTFDEHVQPLDPAILAQRSVNRRSVIFTAQNEYLEASETEWTDEEDENGDWYEDGEEEDEEEGDEDEDHEDDEDFEEDLEELEADDDPLDDEDEYDGDDMEDVQQIEPTTSNIQEPPKTSLQLEAERVQREILNDQIALKVHATQDHVGHQPYQPEQDEDPEDEEDEEVEVTNRYRKPLLDEVDLMFANTEPRVISLTPPIARDDNLTSRVQSPPGKPKALRRASEEQPSSIVRRLSGSSPQPSHTQTSSPVPTSTKSSDTRSPSFESEEEDREKTKKKQEERTTAKLNAILGKNNTPAPALRLTKEEYEVGLPPEAPIVKKPGKFKSLFGVGKSSKEKERKEKERLEKERLKNLAKNTQATNSMNTNNGLFRTRSNSNGSVGTQVSANNTTSIVTPLSPTSPLENKEPHQQEILALRVYPGNVDFGASMYKTVVVTPTTMASDVAHQAVIKFRLAPDGTASTGDFFLTVRGVDGDETVLQPTDKPMTIYQSLTAHLTTPLPLNHRLSISSVSSMMSATSTSSHNSNPQTLRRTGSNRGEQQQRSIRFLLNKKIRRASSISLSSLPTTPTTPTTPQEDFFWVKVVCQAQDLPQSMLLLDGMGTALEKSNPRVLGQSLATKVEHWIPMHATSNAGDVIFRTLERVGIRSGVVDGVPEHVLTAKRATVPNGLVIEYQLALKLNGTSSRKNKQGDEVPLAPQAPLIKCFEDHQLIPVRRSPKADVASMPLHPDHAFFLRKAPKSLQAEMKFVQEQLMMHQQRPAPRKVPAPLQASRSGDSDNSAQPSPTGLTSPRSESAQGRSDASSPPPQNRSINQAFVGGNRIVGGAASPIRIPRRTDSVILSPTSPIRGNSFDSGRPSPTLSTQSLMTTQTIPHPQMSRTPTPDHAGMGSRARSPSAQGNSPGSLRGLQAPSPAPSNLSSNMGANGADQEGSRSSTPERPTRFERPDRQRATSPPLTHGPSPLSMSAIMNDDPTSPSPLSASTERPGFFSKNSFSAGESPSFHQHKNSARFNVKKNAGQGVDIVLNKGVIRSLRTQSSSSSLPSGYYRYTFLPLEGEEEIDVSEIMEDILGGDESDSDIDQEEQQDQGLAGMSRRERAAAAVARASKLVAASKERRRASASSQSNVSTSLATKSSKWADRDRLEFLASSPRGGDTLMKLERALTGDEATASSARVSIGLNGRNLPSPMSLNSVSATPSPSQRRSSDAEILSAVAGSRNQSPLPTVVEGKTSLHGDHPPSLLPRRLQTPSPSPSPSGRLPISIQTAVAPSSGPSSATVTRSSSGSPSYAMSRTRSASASVAEISRLDTRLGLSRGGPSSPSRATPTSPTAVNTVANDPWLLSSDYNTGMQDLLTLVRGGRSSSVSHIHSSSSLSSTHNSRGLVIGKDGKIVPPAHQSTLSSPSSLSSLNSNISRNDGKVHQLNNTKDTQSDERSFNTSNGRSPYEHYDDNNNHHQLRNEPSSPSASSSPTSLNTFNSSRAGSSAEKEQETSSSSRIWTRTDLRLTDVRRECHPEVFECWRDVDADLEKVERDLNSLLATVKATTF
ncbi:hypothetical protein BG005_000033 [Podila minutissima]|nr:hypothetical protein BG005_000033 [Podila minutissima]